MSHEFTRLAALAVERYAYFLTILRSQSDSAMRRGPTNEEVRRDATRAAQEAGRRYVSMEQGFLNDDFAAIARVAWEQAAKDLEVAPIGDDHINRIGAFIFEQAAYVARLMSAQVERDVMNLAQHLLVTGQRVDLYVRSGRHTASSAAAAVMLEDNQMPAFRFMDRLGRRFKSSKHIRDTYRGHLLHVYNEVYMDVVAAHGWDAVKVTHPDPNYKWFGEELAIVSADDDRTLYYDVKDEVFHPGSDATVTIL